MEKIIYHIFCLLENLFLIGVVIGFFSIPILCYLYEEYVWAKVTSIFIYIPAIIMIVGMYSTYLHDKYDKKHYF